MGREKALFPPHPQARVKVLGTRLETSIALWKHFWKFGRTRKAVGTWATSECFPQLFIHCMTDLQSKPLVILIDFFGPETDLRRKTSVISRARAINLKYLVILRRVEWKFCLFVDRPGSLKVAQNSFQYLDFDELLKPLFITWCYNHGIKELLNYWWTRYCPFHNIIGYHSNSKTS